MKVSSSSEQRPPRFRGSWPRRFAGGLAIALIMGVALWWNREALMHWGLQQLLDGTKLSTPRFSGFQAGLERCHLEEMEFGIDSGTGPLSIRLQGVNANYDLSAPTLDTIAVAHAELKFSYRPQEKAETETPSYELPFPLPRLSVDQLDLEVETPWGLSRFAGRATVEPRNAGRLEARFQDDKQTIRFEFSANLSSAKAIVEHPLGGTIFELNATRLDQAVQHASLDANAGSLLEWLSSSELTPDSLRTKIAASASSQTRPDMASIRLQLSADTRDHFDSARGRLMLTRDHGYLADANLTLAPPLNRVEVDGYMDMAATDAMELIKPWLPETLGNWQLTAGRAVGTLKLSWQPNHDSAGTAHLKAYDIDLNSDSVQIDDAYLELNIEDLAYRSMALTMEVSKLVVGKDTTARNLAVKAELLENELTLEQATLPVFGGLLEILPATVNIDRTPIDLILGVQNVDLSQLLASLNYPALSGTGSISGKLPLRLTADAIELQDGTLKGTRPGVIQYQGPVSDNSNLAFKALRNLIYHSLQAKVNYRPNGDYQLGLRLEGNNPKVLSGQPFAFNLNLSGQLPELLQKGILAGDFDRSILEQAISEPASTKPQPSPR